MSTKKSYFYGQKKTWITPDPFKYGGDVLINRDGLRRDRTV